jgi:hypothetical protein
MPGFPHFQSETLVEGLAMESGRRGPPVLFILFITAALGAAFYALGLYLFLIGSRWLLLWLLTFLGSLGVLAFAVRGGTVAKLRTVEIVAGSIFALGYVLVAGYLGITAY